MPGLTCRGCSGASLATVLDLGSTPLADSFPPTRAAARTQRHWPLRVVVCQGCWLVQLTGDVPDDLLFGADYAFFSGTSPALAAHLSNYARWAMDTFADEAGRGVVEVACNDGTMLASFHAAGLKTVGIDPAGPPTERALARGLDVRVVPFGLQVARDIGWSDVLVVANNVLAHVADPHDVLDGIRVLVGGSGAAVLEFQYVGDLIAGNAFDLCYHEHRSFLSLSALRSMADLHDLVVADAFPVPTQGGSLRVVLRPAGTFLSSPRVNGMWQAEGWLRSPHTYAGIQGRMDHVRDLLTGVVAGEQAAGRRLAGYAATAKSCTLLGYCGIGSETLEYVVDTSPSKIGRFTPGTGIPVISPAQEQGRERADTYLLLAANYLPAVLRRERSFMDAGGRIIVPTPIPVVL